MAVFENESDASQDANYREHLDRNWDNGNINFDNLFGKYNGLLDEYDAVNSRLDDAEQEISGLQSDIKALTEKHNEDIKAAQEQLDQLNNVVFGHVHEINYDKPQVQDSNDYYEVIDKSKKRHLLNKNPVSHELNYSAVNGKHNSIEIDTGVGHMKGEKL